MLRSSGTDLCQTLSVSRLVPRYSPPYRKSVSFSMYPLRKTANVVAYERFMAWSPEPPNWLINDLIGRSIKQLVPSASDIGHNVSFANFLIELRDFKHLAHNMIHVRPWLVRFRKELNVKSIGDVLKLATKLPAEGRLLVEFAIRPFVSDLSKLRQGLMTVQQYIDKWNADADYGVVRSRHLDISDDLRAQNYIDWLSISGSQPSIIDNSTGAPVYLYTSYNGYRDVKGFVHFAYKPKRLPPESGIKSILRRCDAVGLGKKGSIIWNALPFSFIADYINSSANCLARFDSNLTELPYEPAYAGYSIKSTDYILSRASLGNSIARSSVASVNYRRREVSCKDAFRYALSPDPNRYVLPSGQQWLNVLALLRLLRR